MFNSFLYQQKTCFKNVSNPSCIDLFLTNNALSFQHTETVSTGLSDFHKLVLTVLKTTISKSKPREIHYRDYKKFDSLKFNVDLKNAFAHENIESWIKFDEVFLAVLNRHATLKKKILRANHASHMSKTLRKAIIRRSYLEKKYLKKKQISLLEPTKSRKIIAVDFTRRKKKVFQWAKSIFYYW